MTLDEAIKTLQDGEDGTVEMLKAKRLGIEALEEVKHLRNSQVLREDELLPSETES